MEVAIHVGEGEGAHVLALVLVLVGEVGVLGGVDLVDLFVFEHLDHAAFNFLEMVETGLVSTFGVLGSLHPGAFRV
jgi:hypothetical protein